MEMISKVYTISLSAIMGRADSLTLRARKARRADNHCMQLAVEAYT